MSEETVMLSAMTTQEYASAKCLLVPKKKFAFGSPVITLVATPRPVRGREAEGSCEADGWGGDWEGLTDGAEVEEGREEDDAPVAPGDVAAI